MSNWLIENAQRGTALIHGKYTRETPELWLKIKTINRLKQLTYEGSTSTIGSNNFMDWRPKGKFSPISCLEERIQQELLLYF